MNIKKSTFLFLAALGLTSYQAKAQHNNEFFNNGALVHIEAGAEVHVWGDVHMNGATATLENDGLIKVQGNMYSDALFQQRGTGTTLLENSDVNTGERQFISGSYAVRGGTPQIGVNDGSFYNLEVNNDQRIVYLVNSGVSPYVADVRNSVNFDPTGLGPANATNIVTHDVGMTGAVAYPANGSGYTAEFGMMNNTPGLGNYINDTWHQSGGDNMSVQDNGYIVGKHRRAVRPTGGNYSFLLGLDPGTAVANNGSQKGFQYTQLNIQNNNYDVLRGYFQAGSSNAATPDIECSGYQMDDFWGDRHGEWVFDDISGSGAGEYEIRVWPQDPSLPFTGSVWTISKDDVFSYPTPSPLHNDCGPTTNGLDRGPFNGFSEFGVVSATIFLETEFLDLTATAIQNKFIKVDWSTSKEQNLDYFEIQRSTDQVAFQTITTHTAVGNSAIPQEYFIDDNAVLPNVYYYYRIKSVNTDGTYEFSNVVVASLTQVGAVENVNLFPNPVTFGNATLEITAVSDMDLTVVVYDAIGQQVQVQQVIAKQGLNTYSIATNDWSAGVYFVHIKGATFGSVKELIKSER